VSVHRERLVPSGSDPPPVSAAIISEADLRPSLAETINKFRMLQKQSQFGKGAVGQIKLGSDKKILTLFARQAFVELGILLGNAEGGKTPHQLQQAPVQALVVDQALKEAVVIDLGDTDLKGDLVLVLSWPLFPSSLTCDSLREVMKSSKVPLRSRLPVSQIQTF
jgi:hypothetical protein